MDVSVSVGHLPESDTFARYCKGKWVFDENKGVAPDAFYLRRKTDRSLDEHSLSGGWLERYPAASREARIALLRAAVPLAYRKRDKFAFLLVGDTVEFVKANTPDARVLQFLHEPEPAHEAHSVVEGTMDDEKRVAALLAIRVGPNTVSALAP